MAGIGLVLNPYAKRHATDPDLADRLARVLGGDGVVRSSGSFEELAEVVAEFARLDIDLLAIAGGDGTNHAVITHLLRAYPDRPLPYLALLRGGTMNTTANSFGIAHRKPETLLLRYKRAYAQQALSPLRLVEPHVLRVGNYYGFIFGTGAIYGFIAEYNSRSDRSSAWAARVLATAIASATVSGPAIRRVAQRWSGSVRFDDGTAFPERDYLSVGASTCGQIGLGFKPFYRSHERHGHIHVLGIHCSAGDFIRGLPRIWRGLPQGGERTYEKLCPRALLVPKGTQVPYMIDGEIYVAEGELEIACGPLLRILVP